MNKAVFKFLKEYSSDEHSINRLLVSSFIYHREIDYISNQMIKRLMIEKNELEYGILVQFMDLVQQATTSFGFEALLELFEFIISPSDKLVNGAIYTPLSIREFITSESFNRYDTKDLSSLKIGDISCGCGGFLLDAAKKIKEHSGKAYFEIFRDNIFGLDIQQYSIERTKILLTLLALSEGEDREEFEFNLYVDNALRFNWLEEDSKIKINSGFDILLGNPPYVCSRNMDEESKALLSNWSVSSTGHPDLYIPFFQICNEYLKEDGILGYITVNTFFKSVNGRAIRKYFSEQNLQLRIIDFAGEQIFKSRSTYTCICFLQKKDANGIDYIQSQSNTLSNLRDQDFQKIPYNCLDSENGWNLINKDMIDKIESIGKKFGELFRTRNGIATLKNHVYIFNHAREDDKYYYIDDYVKIEKEICKDIINPNRLIKNRSLGDLKHKIIFPYTYDSDCNVQVVNEVKLSTIYPNAYKYLLSQRELLSTRDKGNGKYPMWYAYGRNQSLEKMKYKLFFPHITPHLPYYALSSDDGLLFYNGIAAVSDNKDELLLLKKIMESDVFWFYIENTSKNYSSGYYSLSRNYIKNFGIYPFTEEERTYILNEIDYKKVNNFICKKYDFIEYMK